MNLASSSAKSTPVMSGTNKYVMMIPSAPNMAATMNVHLQIARQDIIDSFREDSVTFDRGWSGWVRMLLRRLLPQSCRERQKCRSMSLCSIP